ncbi:MAG: ABC transporter ATP-binding protein [Bacteroidales bacterium]|nr:ABC transporter ATP-binding protein [Bacteroidales bacterium]
MRNALKYARWLYVHSKGARWQLSANVLLGTVNVALNMAFILVCKHMVDLATGVAEGSLLTWAIWAGIIMLSRLAVSAINVRIENLVNSRMNFSIRAELYGNLMQAEWLGKEKRHSGDVINRLEQDVTKVTDVICTDVPQIFTTLVQMLAAVAVLCTMDWRLAVLLVLITPLFMLFSKLFFRKMRKMTLGIRESESKIQSHMQESLRHRVMIRSMEGESRMMDRLDSLQSVEYGQVVERTNFNVFARTMVSASFASGYLAAFLWGVFGIARRGMTFGVMTSFLQLVGQIQRPVVNLMHQIPSFIYATASIDRLMELEDTPKEEVQEPVKLEGPVGIRVQDLHYRYPDGDKDVLRGLSFDFPPLSRTAIVGETGAGKSTLIRIMMALLKPSAGEVVLYNKDREIPASGATRCNIVYVPQGNSLLSGTIRENLLMGNPRASDDDMWNALRTAAADFVESLEDVCGEGGTGLSEGQAQRIAIARGLLREGDVLLLDEFSSSLDPETEERLMKSLIENAAGKTLIFITHRERISDYCQLHCRVSKN